MLFRHTVYPVLFWVFPEEPTHRGNLSPSPNITFSTWTAPCPKKKRVQQEVHGSTNLGKLGFSFLWMSTHKWEPLLFRYFALLFEKATMERGHFWLSMLAKNRQVTPEGATWVQVLSSKQNQSIICLWMQGGRLKSCISGMENVCAFQYC